MHEKISKTAKIKSKNKERAQETNMQTKEV